MSCSCPQDQWPEPIVRVQSISESGSPVIPDRYIKPPSERPSKLGLLIQDEENLILPDMILNQICMACQNWGFFQIVNHGVSPDLLHQVRDVWRQFFHLPYDQKQIYANSPKTYEGYGSRLGVEKGAILDWNDYFYLHYLPQSLRDHKKWPAIPSSCREVVDEYCYQLVKLSKNLLKILSITLGLGEGYLQNAFGGEEIGVCMRVNFYPKCPQPDLTLGLSSHSDPGGMTLLLPDDHVVGLQVRKDDNWVTVKPAPDAFIVNIGDQVQVLSNAIYKSVEHRVTVNSVEERVSLAFFYNPRGDLILEPAKELITLDRPALYQPMTFNEYRRYIRTMGPRGKIHLESLKSPR
ncbi:Oxoglutarate/iron-dependent dioxygenase [Macleaya cordata]|uniref:Oxoglutarate/iron-dependent dioxygenase n=1 Tax=Macleaya cordata TaxID=56857 RepID=A0A200PLL5_MACCD|nr:Oxoglutarate/iron-dependent dioxygenase [Macleaya cordata]